MSVISLAEVQNVENETKRIFMEVFANINDESFDWKARQEDYLNWDSFAHLELITSTESKFKIKISPVEALSVLSAEDLLNLVKSRV